MGALRARTRAALASMALAACSPAPPAAPVVTLAEVPSATATATTPRPPPEPRPWAPKPPFAIVARAGPEDDFAIFPLEKGDVIVAAANARDLQGTLRLARIDGDAIIPAPELRAGLPAAVFRDKALPLVAGRYPDALWLARGDVSCEAYQWSPGGKTWEARAAKPRPGGKCTHLAAWTAGAAIASVEGARGPSLAAFGKAPRAVPALPPRAANQPRECGSRLALVQHLFGFPTGEVIVVGAACGVQQAWLVRWPSGSAKGDAVDAEVDPNTPYLARALSKDEVVVDGAGVLPQAAEMTSVEVRFLATSGRLRRASIEPHAINALERWMYEARGILGLPAEDPSDGFRYEGYSLTDGDDVLAFGKLVRDGKPVASLLLRSRQVSAPAEMR